MNPSDFDTQQLVPETSFAFADAAFLPKRKRLTELKVTSPLMEPVYAVGDFVLYDPTVKTIVKSDTYVIDTNELGILIMYGVPLINRPGFVRLWAEQYPPEDYEVKNLPPVIGVVRGHLHPPIRPSSTPR